MPDSSHPTALANLDLIVLNRFRLLIDGISDYAIYMLAPDGTVTTWNSGARRFTGYEAQEIIGKNFSLFYGAEDRTAGVPQATLYQTELTGHFEEEGWRYRKDGTRFWASVVIDVIRDHNNHLIGYAQITRDITERKEAAEALRASEQQFRLLVQGVTDYAIYMLDTTGIVTNWNAGAERIKGYSAEEDIGTHFSRFYIEEDRQQNKPKLTLATALSDGCYNQEGMRVSK